RFTKVIIDYFMIRKPSISRRNRINWHYVRDDAQFSTIKVQRGSGTDEGTGSKPGVLDVPSDDSEEELSWNSSDDEDDFRLSEEARIQEEEDADELYHDVNINQGRG
nr:hypothetical protein [Tanacetum cinerariifolium]